MKKNNKDLIIGICFFITALIIFVATPIVCLKFCENSYTRFREKNNESVIAINTSIKIDDDKDYIYFIGGKVNRYPIINLKSDDAKNMTIELQNYIDSFNANIEDIDNSACYYYESNDIFNYGIFTTNDYVTLLIRISPFKEELESTYLAYTFDLKTGKRLDYSELLKIYNINLEEVLEQIKDELNEEQRVIDEIEYIKIDETINELKNKNNYVIYIDEYGDLLINYIVKTNFVDYNDISKINR